MSSNALLNSGDCEHSLYLGCKHCNVCKVREFAKKQAQREREEEQAWVEAKIALLYKNNPAFREDYDKES